MVRLQSALSLAILVILYDTALGQNISPPPVPTPPAGRTVNSNGPATQSDHSSSVDSLSDFELATWLLIESDGHYRISQTAERQAHNADVKQFAQRMLKHRNDFHNQLLRTLRVSGEEDTRSSDDASSNVGALLDELSVRLQARDVAAPSSSLATRPPLDKDANINDGIPPAERRETLPNSVPQDLNAPTIRPTETRNLTEDATPENTVREAAQEVRRDRLQDRLERLGIRRDSANRVGARDNRVRDLMRDALPVIRQNLPEILDVLGEVAEDAGGEPSSLALMQLQREISQNLTTRINDELSRTPGAFDQGYLGYELVAHDRMISAIQVAKQYASPSLRSVLEQQLVPLNGQLLEARRLMQEK